MTEKMERVEIVGPLALMPAAVDAIQREGVLHIEEIPLSEYGEKQFLHRVSLSDGQMQDRKTIQELVELLQEALRFFPPAALPERSSAPGYAALYARWEARDLGSISVAARSLHAKARSFLRRRRNLSDDIEVLAGYEDVAAALAPLVESSPLPPDYEFIGLVFEAKNRMPRELFRQELRKITNGEFRYHEAASAHQRVSCLVGFSRRHSHAVKHLVIEHGLGQLNLPRYLRDRPFEQALAQMQEDMQSLRAKLASLEEQAQGFYAQKAVELLAMLDVCVDRRACFKAISTIATTRYTFIVWGWIPAPSVEKMKQVLALISDGSVVLRGIRPNESENPPVVLENPRAARQFEPLLWLFPLPRYGTVDPTSYMAAFFPPIFGLMLADAAYGLLLGLGAGLLYLFGRGRPLARKLAFVAAACAFFVVVFGLVFGEFLGELGRHWFGLQPLWRERFSLTGEHKAETLIGYMAIAIAVGVLQVLLGLALGMLNARRTGDRGLFVGNLARIAGVFVLLFFTGRLVQLLPPIFTTFGLIALVIFAVLMIVQTVHRPLHGLLLPLEVLGTLGNILSYVRIMAIGLVSVVLAFLANLFGGMIGNVVLAFVIAALVHTLNLALGIIDPTIQGLRLHYVEFFSKFFIGGGMPYAPFRKTGGAS